MRGAGGVHFALVAVLLVLQCGTLHAEDDRFIEDSFAIVLTKDEPGGNFGTAVDISGDWALLSSPSDDVNRGAVHAYFFTGWNWTLSSTLRAPVPTSGERFGSSVSLHEQTGVVGVPLHDASSVSDSGAAFVYHRNERSDVWSLEAILAAPTPVENLQCAVSVAVRDDYAVIGCPFEADGGVVHLFQRVPMAEDPAMATLAGVVSGNTWTHVTVLSTVNIHNGDQFGFSVAIALSYNPDAELAIKYDPHQFVDVPTQNYTIVIGVPREFGPSRASGGVQVFHYDYIGQRDCPNVTQCIRDRRWYEGPFLSTPDGLVNQHTGYDVVLDRGVIVAGAPGDWTDNLENSGSAYIWRRATASDWTLEAKLRPDDVAANDYYGWTLGLFGNASVVCAPFADPWEENSGKCYFYLFNATVWEQATRVTALDHAAQDTFGMQVSLDTGAVMGSGDAANFKGRVYHFGGYEFFPIPPPIFEPPPGSYLIPGPFELTAITGLPSEQVYYSFNDTNPTPFDDLLAKNHKLTLPFSPDPLELQLSAMSANERLGRLFMSAPVTYAYQTWYPTPGLFWEDLVLKDCGHPRYFCPGTYEDPNRHLVEFGRYSVPDLPNRTATRQGQEWCEQEFYCLGGLRFDCEDPTATCWPYPVQVVVMESDDPARRAPGISVGDRVMITFSVDGNLPNVTTHVNITKLVSFSTAIAGELSGRWVNRSTLEVTIESVLDTDPLFTRLSDSLTLFIHREGGLRRVNQSTQPADFPQGFLLRAGSWGDYDEPSLVEARAEFSNTTLSQHSAHGPSFGDSLILTFDLDLDTTIPAYTRAQVDALVEFIPPFDDIDYVGNWTARNQLTVTFVTHADAKTYFEDHLRGRFAVGKMAVRMRSTSPLRVRDRSSPFMRSQQLVTVTGSWGDIARDVYITLDDRNALTLFFRAPITNKLYNTSGYVLQVSTDEDFGTLVYDEFMPADIAQHFHDEPYMRTFGLVEGTTYYVRVLTYNDDRSIRLGPHCISRPPKLTVSMPAMLEVLSEPEIPTPGASLTFRINDLGRGPLADADELGLTAEFNNGDTFHYASNCFLDIYDGSIMTCDAEAGTGTQYAWTFTARGLRSAPSPFVTKYQPPVIYFFHDSSPGLANALTNGSQTIILRGANFGLVATNNVTRVIYWPNAFPHVVFTATNCRVTRDHEEVTCLTDTGAGTDLRWNVQIADQPSAVISTSYAIPSIHRVWLAAPSNPSDTAELTSGGNEVIVLAGENLGPIRDDVQPIVTYNLTQAPMGISDDEVRKFGFTLFTAVGCHVAALHTQIRCRSFPGFASRAMTWTVEVLGQASKAHQGSLRYGTPLLYNLDNSTTPTQAEAVRVITGLHFAKMFALSHTNLVYRGREVARERWETVSETMIRFLVPNGTGALNPLQLNVNGAFSNTLMLAYEPPTIDDVSLKWQEDDQLAMWQIHAHPSFPDDGITDLHREPLDERCLVLRVRGKNFGADAGVVQTTVDDTPCESITLHSHFLLECCTHERRGQVVVTVNAQASQKYWYNIDDVIPVVAIHSVSPDTGPSIGSQLVISGVEFQSGGGPLGWVRVSIPGHEATDAVYCDVVSYIDSEVVCDQRPSDYRYTATVELTVVTYSYAAQRNVTSNPFTFKYTAPNISKVYPVTVPGRGGVVELAGSSFGSEGAVWIDTVYARPDTDPDLVLARKRCWPVLSWNHTFVSCIAPRSAGNASLTVDVSWTETLVAHSLVEYRPIAPGPIISPALKSHPCLTQVLVCVMALVVTLLRRGVV